MGNEHKTRKENSTDRQIGGGVLDELACPPTQLMQQEITDNLEELMDVVPPPIRRWAEAQGSQELLEIVLDLGRLPEARYPGRHLYLGESEVTESDLEYVIARVGEFGKDNRAGIERTLHRISAIRNRRGKVVGITLRIGRAIYGTVDIMRDVVEKGKSILVMGRPGIGKTTKLREMARILSTEFDKRVVIVDTSNEIAGDGDVPHPAIGRARRMQVAVPELQHAVMIEAVENHMPEAIVIDEIGTEQEAYACRTIAERGVQLVATAHGNSLENLISNPTLCDLIGGIQAVTLSDEEAKKRGTQKTVLERKAPPTFDVVVELLDVDRLAIHFDVAHTVDRFLRGHPPQPEVRVRTKAGTVEVLTQGEKRQVRPSQLGGERLLPERKLPSVVRIFPYGVSRARLERAVHEMRLPAVISRHPSDADVTLALKAHVRREGTRSIEPQGGSDSIYVLRSNTYMQISQALREVFELDVTGGEAEGLREAEEAVRRFMDTNEPVDLSPQSARVRRIQHQIIEAYNLRSESIGAEPYRYVRITKS